MEIEFNTPLQKKLIVTVSYIFLFTLLAFAGYSGSSKAEESDVLAKEENSKQSSANLDDAKQLVEVLKSTTTYQADFKQSVFRDDAIAPDVTTGRFLIHRPNHFKWHTQTTYEQLIIADGDHLWTYDPDLEQVTIQNQNLVLTNSPLLLLTSGVDDLVKVYDIQRITSTEQKNTEENSIEENNSLLFLLKPKENSLFESVHILVKDKNITEFFLKDALGSKTSVEFSNIIRNAKIDVKEFVFAMPDGTDVIDSRENL